MSKIPQKEAVAKIANAIDALRKLGKSNERLSAESEEFQKWHRDTKVMMGYVFGRQSEHMKEFEEIRFRPTRVSIGGRSAEEFAWAFHHGLTKVSSMLSSILQEVEEYWEKEEADGARAPETKGSASNLNRVFIVHGRDEKAKIVVARFLEKLDLQPVILHEQPNGGRTIIESLSIIARLPSRWCF